MKEHMKGGGVTGTKKWRPAQWHGLGPKKKVNYNIKSPFVDNGLNMDS